MSQLEFIKSHIEKYGEVSRNTALANHITRLSAIMFTLRKVYEITGEWRGGDYVYKWSKWVKPRTEIYWVKDGNGAIVDTIRKEVTMKM